MEMNNGRPLSGYRVVELCTFAAGPTCARLMADWGADVIKVEPPDGDPMRAFGATMAMPVQQDECPAWELYNANKRAIVLDLKTAAGQGVLHKLLETVDVFITSYRPQALRKLKIDYDSLRERYPRLVYAFLSGFGEKGPDVGRPGFDITAFWTRSGFAVDLVKPNEYPVYPPAGFGDTSTGSTLVAGVCAALLQRGKTGKGEKISISLYGTAVWFSGLLITSTQDRYKNKFPKHRYEATPNVTYYRSKDGDWVIISILEYERYFPGLAKAVGREDLINDPRFNTSAQMVKYKGELVRALEDAFAAKTTEELLKNLTEADIVHDLMPHFKDVITDEQALANNMVHDFTFANGAKVVLPHTPLKFAGSGELPYERGPLLGEHTREVLSELGYSANQIQELTSEKNTMAK